MTLAWVVAIPCGQPGYTFSVARWSSLARLQGGSPIGTIWSSSPCASKTGDVDLFDVFGEFGFRDGFDAVIGRTDLALLRL